MLDLAHYLVEQSQLLPHPYAETIIEEQDKLASQLHLTTEQTTAIQPTFAQHYRN